MSTETAEVVSATVELTFADGTAKRIELDSRDAQITLSLDEMAVLSDPDRRQAFIVYLSGLGPRQSSAGRDVSKEPQK